MPTSKIKRFRVGILALSVLILMNATLACRTLLPVESTSADETTMTIADTPVPTQEPTDETLEQSDPHPPTPPQVLDCSVDAILRSIRIPYIQSNVLHNRVGDISFLNIWFVDPDLDPLASGGQIEENVSVAVEHAIQVVHRLVSGDDCIVEAFDILNPIVVDLDYNGWLSANFDPPTLAQFDTLDGGTMESIESQMLIGYARQVTTDPRGRQNPPAGACRWPQALDMLWTHFSPERRNVGFYFVIDETGINVYAQWDGPTDALMYASLANVGMELVCLHPAIDWLNVTVVDEEGNIKLIGRVAGDIVRSNDVSALINNFVIIAQP